jgi:hypothetical protein
MKRKRCKCPICGVYIGSYATDHEMEVAYQTCARHHVPEFDAKWGREDANKAVSQASIGRRYSQAEVEKEMAAAIKPKRTRAKAKRDGTIQFEG